MSRVGYPSLRFMEIELFHQILVDIPEFCRSIPLLNAFKSPAEVKIDLYTKLVVIYFIQKGKHGTESGDSLLKTVCQRLDWQLSFVTQVSSQLSPLLKSVDTLIVSLYNEMPSGENMDPTQWLELFQPFTRVRQLRVSGQSVLDIVKALVTEDMGAGILTRAD